MCLYGQNPSEKSVIFTSETLKKCLVVFSIVQYSGNHGKHSVEISTERSLNVRYHTQCYNLVTAIKIPPKFQNIEH